MAHDREKIQQSSLELTEREDKIKELEVRANEFLMNSKKAQERSEEIEAKLKQEQINNAEAHKQKWYIKLNLIFFPIKITNQLPKYYP